MGTETDRYPGRGPRPPDDSPESLRNPETSGSASALKPLLWVGALVVILLIYRGDLRDSPEQQPMPVACFYRLEADLGRRGWRAILERSVLHYHGRVGFSNGETLEEFSGQAALGVLDPIESPNALSMGWAVRRHLGDPETNVAWTG